MVAGSTNGATIDRSGGGVHVPLRVSGTQRATKSGEGHMDPQGDMETGKSEGSTTMGTVSEHEGGLQGAARLSARNSRG